MSRSDTSAPQAAAQAPSNGSLQPAATPRRSPQPAAHSEPQPKQEPAPTPAQASGTRPDLGSETNSASTGPSHTAKSSSDSQTPQGSSEASTGVAAASTTAQQPQSHSQGPSKSGDAPSQTQNAPAPPATTQNTDAASQQQQAAGGASVPDVDGSATAAAQTSQGLQGSQGSQTSTDSSPTLYVSDLDPLVNEVHLQAAFYDVASALRTIRVARDPITQRSLGYGYVNFVSHDAAVHALNSHSPLFVGASMCRVFLYPGKHAFVRPGKPAGEGLFIKNLDPAVQVSELYQAFSQFGTVVGCRVALGDFGRPRGFAYVSFDSREHAVAAINEMNGTMFHNRRLFVGHNLPRRERIHKYDETKEEFTNLFIKGIASHVQEEQFFEFFAKIGPIDSYSMPLDEFGSPRGFGFVNFKNHSDAVRAVDELNGKLLAGRDLLVARALQRENAGSNAPDSPGNFHSNRQQSASHSHGHGHDRNQNHSVGGQSISGTHQHGPQPPAGTNLYVKYLDKAVTDDMLAKEFRPFGDVVSAKVMMDEHGESRGFGFVCYEDPEIAEKAIEAMHNTEHWGNVLFVAPAQRRERRGGNWFRGGSPSSAGSIVGHGINPVQYMPLNMMGMMQYLPNQYMSYYGQWPGSAAAAGAGASAGDGTSQTAGSAGSESSNPYAQPYVTAPSGYPQYYYGGQQYSLSQQQQPAYAAMQAGSQGSATQSPQLAWAQVQPGTHGYKYGQPRPLAAGTNYGGRSSVQGSVSHSASPAPGNGSSGPARRAKKQQGYAPSLAAAVASAENPEAEKQVIGEALYPRVLNHSSVGGTELASRVTGVLLEGNKEDLIQWLDDEETLSVRIQQARDAYYQWESQQTK